MVYTTGITLQFFENLIGPEQSVHSHSAHAQITIFIDWYIPWQLKWDINSRNLAYCTSSFRSGWIPFLYAMLGLSRAGNFAGRVGGPEFFTFGSSQDRTGYLGLKFQVALWVKNQFLLDQFWVKFRPHQNLTNFVTQR